MRLLAIVSLLLWATLVARTCNPPGRTVKGWHPALAVLSSIVLATWAAS